MVRGYLALLPAAPAEAGLRAALLRAVEEVGNAWYDEDGTVIWREELWDRLVILRREYGTIEEAELAALAAQEGAGE